ncbi:MAG: hypothetical protein WA952_16005 [Lewinella sp.]
MKGLSSTLLAACLLLAAALAGQCLPPTLTFVSKDMTSVTIENDSIWLLGPVDNQLLTLIRKTEDGEDLRLDSTITEVSRTFKLAGLQPGGRYALVGRAACGSETSRDSDTLFFTTLSSMVPPNDLRANAIEITTEVDQCTPITGTTCMATVNTNPDECILEDEEDV